MRAFLIGWLIGKFFPRLAIVLLVMIVGSWFLVSVTFFYVSKTGLLVKGHSAQKEQTSKKQ